MKRVNAAALQGTKVLVSELLEHDRFKKPAFAPLDQIAAIRAKPTLGMLEIEAGGTILSARIPKRERLNEVAREVSDAIRVARAAAAT